MAIHRLLENSGFDQERITVMMRAYNEICRRLHLGDGRYDAVNELLARKVIAIAQTGDRDPNRIVKRVLKELRLPPAK
jgi:hypothetical protein